MGVRAEYLEILEGYSVMSIKYEGVVDIRDGKIFQDGEVIVEEPTDEDLKELSNEMFYQEFGTYNVGAVLQDEFGDDFQEECDEQIS